VLSRLAVDRAARHVVPAVVTACGVEIGLRTLDLRRLARLAGVSLELAPSSAADNELRIDNIDSARVRAVQIVMRRWPWGARGPCLRHALVAGRMLRHRRPSLVLGVGRDGRGTLAHAWLLIDGVALDPDTARWTPLLTPGAA
jgi:Transglutaminase-like superfamily